MAAPHPLCASSLPISFWGRLWSGITGQSLCTNATMRNALSPLFTEMLQKIWVMMTLPRGQRCCSQANEEPVSREGETADKRQSALSRAYRRAEEEATERERSASEQQQRSRGVESRGKCSSSQHSTPIHRARYGREGWSLAVGCFLCGETGIRTCAATQRVGKKDVSVPPG